MASRFPLRPGSSASDHHPTTPTSQTPSPPLLPPPPLSTSSRTTIRPRRAPKPPAPKRPPQRGLGVAQLERIRMQEIEMSQHSSISADPTPYVVPVNYLQGHWPPAAALARSFVVGGDHHPYYDSGAVGPCVSVGSGGFDGRARLPEPPSNQMTMMTRTRTAKMPMLPYCSAYQCEFCARVINKEYQYQYSTSLVN